MKNVYQKGVVIITIILIIVAFGFMVFNSGGNTENENHNMSDDVTENTDAMMEESMEEGMEEGGSMTEENMVEGELSASRGTYEEYSPEKVAQASDRKVVIFFHAAWCPTCRVQEKNILENIDDLPNDLTILKADFDTEIELKKKYGVRLQHTFVQVDENGEMLKAWTGGQTIQNITDNII